MAWHRSGGWARRCRSTHCCRSSPSGAPRTRASTCAKRAMLRVRAPTRPHAHLRCSGRCGCRLTCIRRTRPRTAARRRFRPRPTRQARCRRRFRQPTSAPGLRSRLPHLHRDWAHPCPHLHRDWPQALADLKRKMSRKTPSGVKALEIEEQDFSERVRQQTKARDWPRVPPEYYRTPRVLPYPQSTTRHPRMLREYPRVPRSTAGPIWQGNPRIWLSWFLLGRARSCRGLPSGLR